MGLHIALTPTTVVAGMMTMALTTTIMVVAVMTMTVRARLTSSLVTAMAMTTMTTVDLQDRVVRSPAKALRIARPQGSRFRRECSTTGYAPA